MNAQKAQICAVPASAATAHLKVQNGGYLRAQLPFQLIRHACYTEPGLHEYS